MSDNCNCCDFADFFGSRFFLGLSSLLRILIISMTKDAIAKPAKIPDHGIVNSFDCLVTEIDETKVLSITCDSVS